jgi:hypothetical protein
VLLTCPEVKERRTKLLPSFFMVKSGILTDTKCY